MLTSSIRETTDIKDIMNIKPESGNKIPKIIHYCWFGGKPLPENLQKYMESWALLKGYTIMRWDESNCSFDENDYIKKAYKENQYCYISDFYRLKALYDWGGIYLDTDVKVFKDFDDLLKHKMFLNFIYESVVGCGIIGAQKNHPLIKSLLEMYDKTVFVEKFSEESDRKLEWDGEHVLIKKFISNNYYFTYYFLTHYPDFRLNNKYQDLGDFVIYPKELFEIGSLTGKHYTIHYAEGAWKKNKKRKDPKKEKVKGVLQNNELIYGKLQMISRQINYKKTNKNLPFYEYSVAQKKGTKLPKP